MARPTSAGCRPARPATPEEVSAFQDAGISEGVLVDIFSVTDDQLHDVEAAATTIQARARGVKIRSAGREREVLVESSECGELKPAAWQPGTELEPEPESGAQMQPVDIGPMQPVGDPTEGGTPGKTLGDAVGGECERTPASTGANEGRWEREEAAGRLALEASVVGPTVFADEQGTAAREAADVAAVGADGEEEEKEQEAAVVEELMPAHDILPGLEAQPVECEADEAPAVALGESELIEEARVAARAGLEARPPSPEPEPEPEPESEQRHGGTVTAPGAAQTISTTHTQAVGYHLNHAERFDRAEVHNHTYVSYMPAPFMLNRNIHGARPKRQSVYDPGVLVGCVCGVPVVAALARSCSLFGRPSGQRQDPTQGRHLRTGLARPITLWQGHAGIPLDI